MKADTVAIRLFEPVELRLETEAVTFAPNGRWQRLQRWAWAFLKRTAALAGYQQSVSSYREWSFEPASVIEAIQAGIVGLYRHHRDPGAILIGSREFSELMRDPSMSFAAMQFEARDRYFYGIKVKVVPWMTGIVVLPEGFI